MNRKSPVLLFGANYVQTFTSGPRAGFISRMITRPDGDIAEDETVTTAGAYTATAPISPSGWWVMQVLAIRHK